MNDPAYGTKASPHHPGLDVAPGGFRRLEPRGVSCRCINMYLDVTGYSWCGDCANKSATGNEQPVMSMSEARENRMRDAEGAQALADEIDPIGRRHEIVAVDIKRRLLVALMPIAQLMDIASSAGLRVQVAINPPNRAKGEAHHTADVRISKDF